MALPFSRNTTFAPLSQVPSADLNDLQDYLIRAHRMRRKGTLWIPGYGYAGAASGTATDDEAWERVIVGGASQVIEHAPDSAYASPYLELVCDEDDTSDECTMMAGDYWTSTANADLIAFLEFDHKLVTTADPDPINWILGWFDATGGGREISFYHDDSGGGNNYHTRVRTAGSATEVDTGVAFSTTWRKLRIEIYGANRGGARVLFYIDGALEATTTTNIPSGGLQPFFQLKQSAGGAAGTTESYLGAVLFDVVP